MISCVSDGEFTACDTTVVTVLPVNDPPVITALDTIFMIEDEPYSLMSFDDMGDNEIFMDPDHEISDLSFSLLISSKSSFSLSLRCFFSIHAEILASRIILSNGLVT